MTNFRFYFPFSFRIKIFPNFKINIMGKINEIHEVEIVYKRPSLSAMEKISCSRDMSDIFRKLINVEKIDLKEFFLVALLSRSNNVLGVSNVSTGTTNGTTVNIKEILQLAIKTNSSSIAICHNHPSGNLSASEADIAITNKIKEACKHCDICLLDHIILTSEGYFSLADEFGI